MRAESVATNGSAAPAEGSDRRRRRCHALDRPAWYRGRGASACCSDVRSRRRRLPRSHPRGRGCPHGADAAARRRTLQRLCRTLHAISGRDYFPPPEREQARRAVDELAEIVEIPHETGNARSLPRRSRSLRLARPALHRPRRTISSSLPIPTMSRPTRLLSTCEASRSLTTTATAASRPSSSVTSSTMSCSETAHGSSTRPI